MFSNKLRCKQNRAFALALPNLRKPALTPKLAEVQGEALQLYDCVRLRLRREERRSSNSRKILRAE